MRYRSILLSSVLLLTACASVPPPPSDDTASDVEGDATQEVQVSSPEARAVSSPPVVEESDGGETMVKDEDAVVEDSDAATKVDGGAKVDGTIEVPTAAPTVRTIDVTTDNWLFSPAAIVAKQGEKVQLRLRGLNGTHGFAVPELGINQSVTAGQTVTVSLPTDRAGTFSLFCSIPCGAGHRDMKGSIVVQP